MVKSKKKYSINKTNKKTKKIYQTTQENNILYKNIFRQGILLNKFYIKQLLWVGNKDNNINIITDNILNNIKKDDIKSILKTIIDEGKPFNLI